MGDRTGHAPNGGKLLRLEQALLAFLKSFTTSFTPVGERSGYLSQFVTWSKFQGKIKISSLQRNHRFHKVVQRARKRVCKQENCSSPHQHGSQAQPNDDSR